MDTAAHALLLLRQALADPAANFRDGQLEAILALAERKARLLLVQRTGWGKSAVYFLSTKLLRERGAGPTLLVSPLLALMRDQIAAAERLGVRAATINSSNKDEWGDVERRLRGGEVDLLLISPERLANDDFVTRVLQPLAGSVGLFVVDEAHCISDWGHDFRPDYRRIVRILQLLPRGVPVCATTATANSRVVADVVRQLGEGLELSRGPLSRSSIRLQTVRLEDEASKLAWLGHYWGQLRKQGTGIVYAHTHRWTERISDWLALRGINAPAYHAGLPEELCRRREIELLDNEVDALVATTKLGMGFDKPDLGFVVHFHQPASVVHYYQQVGRAGRAIPLAYGVMLSGGDDRDINDHFIREAFPPEGHLAQILAALEGADDGLSLPGLERAVNLKQALLEKALKALSCESPSPVARIDRRWARTPINYDPSRRRALADHVTALRREEQRQMDVYAAHEGCLMEFLANALDDPHAAPCGECAFCRGRPDAMRTVPHEARTEAVEFLRGADIVIEPRKLWPADAFPTYGWSGRIAAGAEEGRALCLLNDAGWGRVVHEGKYAQGLFGDDLVEALAALVRRWAPRPAPAWVTCIPSQSHPALVPSLAEALAARLSLRFFPAVERARGCVPQKSMENSWQQAHNLDGVFRVRPWDGLSGTVLLVDDITDSGWTFTVAAALLREAGSGPVFPLALAANR